MPTPAGIGESSNYFWQVFVVARASVTQVVSRPSHARRAEAARRLARHSLLITATIGAAIIALMYALDAREIELMPARGTAGLWPVRILTDFGKDAYVLSALGGALLLIAIIAPLLPRTTQPLLLALATRLEFLFFAVLAPVLAGQVIKWMIGRGRPFVGGKANAFNFWPFNGTEAYASLPSSHAITAFALAFAVSSLWPKARVPMFAYACLIAITRLVLLAHHPSDVVAGALIGVIGAMFVRHWFAARHLAFTIRRDGAIVPFPGQSLRRLKRVARRASAP